MTTPQIVSQNFSSAKVIAILAVTTAHFFANSPLWMAAQIALFVFAFSSGYFTAERYPRITDTGAFWRAKILRLGPSLLVINLFLCLVFIATDRDGILSLYTPLALVGLSGIYDWLGVRNQSPFGYGLWFFTVLLCFYAIYPWLAIAFSRQRNRALLVGGALCLLGMHLTTPPYALWQTIFGFVLGVFVAFRKPALSSRLVVMASVGTVLIGLGLNAFSIKLANPYLLIALSICCVCALLCFALPQRLHTAVAPFKDSVLEIYLIHSYLFLPTQAAGSTIAFVGSLILIVSAAILLSRASSAVDRLLFNKPILKSPTP